ncbi:nuclear transport factor 2 family protein [Azoarcus sp. KH32C]|uniref:nuclear transport factor 2 family protein n=1 Tax=Azoarcus sp. KH32C TaxID=748247 RepID=UPI0002386602|nr:nuclear transport factor 2 family protein [Azoarcus sp. KH32C]BAL24193.1 hypothetical protein AZKH_1880 [Azoarcus sp. KH32C]
MMRQLALAALTLCGMPLAAHASGDDFAKALDERYRAIESAIKARDSARWFEVQYAVDAVVTGEGAKQALRGRDGLMPVLNDILKNTRSCAIEPDAARQASTNLGYSFATFHCNPADTTAADYQVRALLVWKKTRAGWRVAAESYTMGSM